MSEILGTLFSKLVALLGIAAVVVILYQVFGANKTQNAISDITQLQANAQALYNGQSTFTSLSNTVAIGGKLAPTDMISGGTLINPFGGSVTIAVNGSSASNFDITEAGLPADACAKIIVGLTSVLGLKVNGTAQALPIDAGTAVTACNAVANTLTLTFTH